MSEPLLRLSPLPQNLNEGLPVSSRQVISPLAGLQVGMEVELRVARLIDPQAIECCLRLPNPSAPWTSGIRAQLIAPWPTAAQSPALRLRAEVLALEPTLLLRPLPASLPETPGPRPVDLSSRAWLEGQLRQHWPAARALAAGLERLAAQLLPRTTGQRLPLPTAPTTVIQAGTSQIQRALLSLFDQLATPADLTDPDRLIRVIERSGLWFEAHLAQAVRDPSRMAAVRADLKAQLLALAQSLRAAAPKIAAAAPAADPSLLKDQPGETPPSGSEPSGKPSGGIEGLGAPDRLQLAEPPFGEGPTQAESQAADGSPIEGQQTADPGPLGEPSPATEPGSDASEPSLADEGLLGQQPPEQPDSQPSQLGREVEGMLKQLITRQLQSLAGPAGQVQWLLELPLKTPQGLLELQADIRRVGTERQGQDVWSIQLRLNLPRLGPLDIRLSLCAGRLTGCLQAADPASAAEFSRHLDQLRVSLEARGIAVGGLYTGQGPVEPGGPPCRIQLLSEWV